MGELKQLQHDRPGPPVLLRVALWHVQFETIHPFLAGNGRVRRLMLTLLLCADGVLREPRLYLSATLPTIAKALDVLMDRNIVSETTCKKRNRGYRYDRYLEVLDEGTEPL